MTLNVLSKMQSLVTLCGLLLLRVSVHAHVVENFEVCKDFFYQRFVPQGLDSNSDVHICQSFKHEESPNSPQTVNFESDDLNYYFATLYDTGRRIPVYSAYVFEKKNDKGSRSSRWFVEPQLVNASWDENMMTAESLSHTYGASIDLIGERQAVDEDYQVLAATMKYDRGHLNPNSHHTDDASKATFTLTNVVPQKDKLNRRGWSNYEQNLKNNCDKAFVLVGAIPSASNWVKRNNVNRVNIPDYMWHAYCCVDNNGNPIKSGAATAKNTENKVQECSLQSLQQFFEKLGKKPVLFENCAGQTITGGDCSSVINTLQDKKKLKKLKDNKP